MSKIRINELARQLEVPSHAIIDMLPELGVTEKKTHSSSVDEPVAEIIRQRVQGGAGAAMRREADASVAVAEREPVEEAARYEPSARHEHFTPQQVPSLAPEHPAPAARVTVPEVESPTATPAQEAPVTTPVSTPGSSASNPMEEPPRTKPAPLRPPLLPGGAAPLHPPIRTGPVPARPVPT